MTDQHTYTNEYTLDFNKDFVKDKINEIFSTKAFILHDRNDLLGTWRFGGTYAITMAYGSTIQIIPTENEKTIIKIQTYNLQSGNLSTSILAKAQSEFINPLTKALQGQEITYKTIESGKAGCFGLVIAIVTSVSLLIIFLS